MISLQKVEIGNIRGSRRPSGLNGFFRYPGLLLDGRPLRLASKQLLPNSSHERQGRLLHCYRYHIPMAFDRQCDHVQFTLSQDQTQNNKSWCEA